MLPIIDTRRLFRPLCADIVALLRGLPSDAWERPTLAGAWRVRDVAAHLLDGALRRLTFDRDGAEVRPAGRAPSDNAHLAAFINQLNAEWIAVARRFSPRVLTDLYASASGQLADFFEQVPLDAPARFPVSWAGESRSAAWLDIGRDFTEIWHHGAQIRAAVGAGPFSDARWLHAVLAIAMHALPHAYRDLAATEGRTVVIEITGESGGNWSLHRRLDGWDVVEGAAAAPADARATMSDDTAWRLLFNALPRDAAKTRVRLDGDTFLARPLLDARAVIV